MPSYFSPGRTSYKVCRNPVSDHFTLQPSTTTTTSRDYRVDIGSRTSPSLPYMFLYEGQARIVASVRRPALSSDFEVGLGDTGPERNVEIPWEPVTRLGGRDAAWRTPDLSSGEGKRRMEVQWKGTRRVAVDGMKASRLTGGGYKLVEAAAPESVLAVFTASKGLGSERGVLQINVDWGAEFERMVIMTFMALHETASGRSSVGPSKASGQAGGIVGAVGV